MDDKFKNVPIDKDTRILGQKEVLIGTITVLVQQWSWDGIRAKSVILCESDTNNMSNDDLVNWLKKMELIPGNDEVTVTRSSKGFDFVNFGFEY